MHSERMQLLNIRALWLYRKENCWSITCLRVQCARIGLLHDLYWALTVGMSDDQAKIVHGFWACTCPCSCSKHNRFSLATPMKFGNFGSYFMLFMPTIIITSCTVHACSWHELGMNKGFNPIFHAHESYSHAHEVMRLLHAHKPEQSLFMGMK